MDSSYYTPTSRDELQDWTGVNRWNAIYTIQLGELIENGIFDWNNSLLNWREHAYSSEQYERVCKYFIERFRFREISIEPFYEWATRLYSKLVYELMPKFKTMYELIDDDFDFTEIENDYIKSRNISSEYPETLLSANADYISDGKDAESEEVKRGNVLDAYNKYVETFQTIDKLLLDELEVFFIGLYTISINGE